MKKHGFGHFVGLDGSEGMLKAAENTGLYQDLRKCMLGAEELPDQWGKVLHHCTSITAFGLILLIKN